MPTLLLVLPLLAAFGVAFAAGGDEFLPYFGLVLLLAALVFFLSPAILPHGFWAGQQRGPVVADATGIRFRDKLLFRRSAIERVSIEENADGSFEVLFLGPAPRDELALLFTNEARARAFLAALDLELDRKTVRLRVLRSPLREGAARFFASIGWFAGATAITLGIVALSLRGNVDALLFSIFPCLILYGILTKRLAWTAIVCVGCDGLSIFAGGRSRSVPFREVDAIEGDNDAIVVKLRNRPAIRLTFKRTDGWRARWETALALLRDRLAESRKHPTEALGAMLARAGRPLPQWISDLRGAKGVDAAYRGGGPPEEALWRVVEDVHAEPSARVGALAVLAPSLDEGGRRRVRIAAEVCALPEVREALRAAADAAEDSEILGAYASREQGE
jgi:hypothetical protein